MFPVEVAAELGVGAGVGLLGGEAPGGAGVG